MDNSDKKKYLKRYLVCYQKIERLYDEKERLQSIRDKVTQTLSDMPKGSSGDKSNVADAIIDLDGEINYQIEKWTRLRRSIGDTIKTVADDNLRLLLEHRYIDGMTFEQIAVKMNYSWRQIHRLHSEALNAVEIN